MKSMTDSQRNVCITNAIFVLSISDDEQEAYNLIFSITLPIFENRMVISYMDESACAVNLLLARLSIIKEK
jgi:hypothetical protein